MPTPVPEWMNEAFDELNAKHFGGKLRPLRYTVGNLGGRFAVYMPMVAILQFHPRTLQQSRAWIADTLLHEMIHHALAEATGGADGVGDPDKGHGQRFCATANRIGAALGLTPVTPASEEAIDWPQSVRPPGHAEWR